MAMRVRASRTLPIANGGAREDMRVRQTRIVGLDPLRVGAALAVMLFHFGYQISQVGHTPYRVSGGTVSFPEIVPYVEHGWMGVQAFFVISGFVIALSAGTVDPARFLARRILRLAPAVWICAPISAAVAVLAGGAPTKVIGKLFNSVSFLPIGGKVDGSYWTLDIEVAFYLVVFLLLWHSRFGYFRHYIHALAVISAAFNVALLAGYDVNFSGRLTKLLLLQHGCQFALGAIAYRLHVDRGNRRASGWREWLFLAIAAIGCYAQLHAPTTIAIWTAFLVVFFVVVAANAWIAEQLNDTSLRLMRRLGEATYPLYLIHQLVGAWLIGCFISVGLSRYAALAAGTAAIFAITAVIVPYERGLRAAIRPAVLGICGRLTNRSPPPADDLVTERGSG